MDPRPIELSGHNRRSEGISAPSRGQVGCGLNTMLRNRGDSSDGRWVRLFCKRRRCPDCGPHRCARLERRYLEMLTAWLTERGPGARLVSFPLAPSAWSSCSRKLRREHLPYLRIPLAAGEDLIVTTNALATSNGRAVDPVDDLGELLARAFTWTPGSGFDRRRPSASGWETVDQVTSDKPAGQSGGVENMSNSPDGKSSPVGWELIGFSALEYIQGIRVLAALDLDQGDIPERELPDDWAEARKVRLPAEGTPEWQRLWTRLKLRLPTTREQDELLRDHRKRLRAGGPVKQDRLPGLAA
jgi:hypothetical protein